MYDNVLHSFVPSAVLATIMMIQAKQFSHILLRHLRKDSFSGDNLIPFGAKEKIPDNSF